MKRFREFKMVLAGALVLFASGLAPSPMPISPRDADAYRGAARRTVRRTARRTTRRTVARHMYALPAGYRTVVVSGVTVYEVGGTRYKKVIIDGRVAYVVY